jgi:ArsR family transcriptional regulator
LLQLPKQAAQAMTILKEPSHPIRVQSLAAAFISPEPDDPTLSFELLTHVGAVLKTLGHPVRLRIVQYLAEGERRVSEIQAQTGLTQPATSQQLRILADKNILARRREGNVIYYGIANEFIWKILDCMQTLSAKISSGEWDLEQIGIHTQGELP